MASSDLRDLDRFFRDEMIRRCSDARSTNLRAACDDTGKARRFSRSSSATTSRRRRRVVCRRRSRPGPHASRRSPTICTRRAAVFASLRSATSAASAARTRNSVSKPVSCSGWRWIRDVALERRVERLRDVATRPELPSGRYVILRPIGRGGMGSRLRGARRATRTRGRDQSLERSGAGRRPRPASAPGGARPRAARTPGNRAGARRRPARRRPMVLRHETGARRHARRARRVARARGRATGGLRARRGDRGVRARGGHRASRSQAVKRHGRPVRRGARARLGRGHECWRERTRRRPLRARRRTPDCAWRRSDGTAGGTRIGTAGFMAPEQAHGDAVRAPDRRPTSTRSARCSSGCGPGTPGARRSSTTCSRHLGAASPAPSKRLGAIIRKCLSPRSGGSLRQRHGAGRRSGALPAGLGGVGIPRDDVRAGRPLAGPLSDVRLARAGLPGDARGLRVLVGLKKDRPPRCVKEREEE